MRAPSSKRSSDWADVAVVRSPPLIAAPEAQVQAFVANIAPMLHLDVGNVCNQACPYCGLDRAQQVYVPTAALADQIKRGAALGLRRISFVGGEPTIQRDLTSLITLARDQGYEGITLTTNGLMLAYPAFLERLVAAGMNGVHLSFDDADPELRARLAGNPKAGWLVDKALENLLGRPQLFLYLYAVVTRETLGRLPELLRHVRALARRAGREIPLVLTALKPTGRAWEHREALLPHPAQTAAAVRGAARLARRLGVPLIHWGLPFCLLRGHEAGSMDALFAEARLDLATGETLPALRDQAMVKQEACADCRWGADCVGVHQRLPARYGWEAFAPVPATDAAPATTPAPLGWLQARAARAVIVGGAGLLGRQLALQLLDAGWDVLITRRAGELPPELQGRARLARLDHASPTMISALLAEAPDLWLDLAIFTADQARALLEVWPASDGPLLGVAGTLAEIDLTRADAAPIQEGTPPDAREGYGRDKVAAWRLLDDAARAGRLRCLWAVLPQLWGPHDPHGRDASWVRQILVDAPIFLRGDGAAALSDGYAPTAAEALLCALGRDELQGRRVHVAGPDVLSPRLFLEEIVHALARPARLFLVPPERMAEAERRFDFRFRPVLSEAPHAMTTPSLERAGFTPRADLLEGVRDTARWHAAAQARAALPSSPHDVPLSAAAWLTQAEGVRYERLLPRL
jgi:nucleoside-diphosphate-sugar epimerase/pyruvate-formate lyase-activating enzyme